MELAQEIAEDRWRLKRARSLENSIFAEGHQTSGRFYGIAATTKTVGKLTLIETQNYTFDQKVIPETQENMDNLMRIAQNDHIKFVKIPEKYSPELLQKARTSCK